MNGGVGLFVEVDRERIERRLRLALRRPRRRNRSTRRSAGRRTPARGARRCRSRCTATPPRSIPELARRGVRPDVVTDQTSAHDMLNGYVPAGLSRRRGGGAARARPQGATCTRAYESIAAAHARHARAAARRAPSCSTTATTIRREAENAGRRRLRLSRLRPRVHPAALLRGAGAVPLGGALRRSRGHLRDRPRARWRPSRTTSTSCAGCSWRSERVQLPGAAGADLLARLRRSGARPGGSSTTWSPPGA